MTSERAAQYRIAMCPHCGEELSVVTAAPRGDGWEEPEVADVPALREVVARAEAAGNPEWAKGARYATEWLRPFLAAARGEPGLDVERLAQVLDRYPMWWEVKRPGGKLVMTKMVGTAEAAAADIAAEYNRLATPTTPEPDQ